MFMRLTFLIMTMLPNGVAVSAYDRELGPNEYVRLRVLMDDRDALIGELVVDDLRVDRPTLADLLANARFHSVLRRWPNPQHVGRELLIDNRVKLNIHGVYVVPLRYLRFVRTPVKGFAPPDAEWKIHPDDQAMIIARWKSTDRKRLAESNRETWRQRSAFIPGSIFTALLCGLLFVIVKNRIARFRNMKLNPPAQSSWLDD